MNENKLPKDPGTEILHPDYESEILALFRKNLTPSLLRDRLLDYHENDIASALEPLGKDGRLRLYALLGDEVLAAVLEYAEELPLYLGELDLRRRVSVLSHFDTPITVEYLSQLEKSDCRNLLSLMDKELRDEIRLLSSFDEDEIGSRMTTNYITIHRGSSVKGAMSALIEQAAENDNISTLYVVDGEGLLHGAIDLKELITARSDTPLDDITVTSYPYVYATEPIEDCMERLRDYSEDSIPVLDTAGRLIGVLISQDITQLVDDEMSDDYAKLAGLSAEEDLREPIGKSIAKRLPWLTVLLGLSLLVSGVVGAFEAVISGLTLIVCFQSLILGMAGNAGTQSLAVTIRILTDECINGRQKLCLILKEARVGLANGAALGILSFGGIGIYIMLFKHYPAPEAFAVSMCTGIALFVSVFLSSITGTVIPLLFKKLKLDPAVASGPMITTINDLVAVVSYYGLAWLLLIGVHGM